MSFAITSDLHIKGPDDPAYKYLVKFLNHEKVLNSKDVFLLGDIFDLLLGKQHFYYTQYSQFFDALKKLIDRGSTIYYFEGNHDFHLRQLFSEFIVKNNLPDRSIEVIKKYKLVNKWNKKFYFAHGDEIEPDNSSYLLYKRVLNNKVTSLLMNYVINGRFIEFVGRHASSLSKKNGRRKFMKSGTLDRVRNKFRTGAEMVSNHVGCDYIICGHSHIKDNFVLQNGSRYINNGHGFNEKTFIYIDNQDLEFIDML